MANILSNNGFFIPVTKITAASLPIGPHVIMGASPSTPNLSKDYVYPQPKMLALLNSGTTFPDSALYARGKHYPIVKAQITTDRVFVQDKKGVKAAMCFRTIEALIAFCGVGRHWITIGTLEDLVDSPDVSMIMIDAGQANAVSLPASVVNQLRGNSTAPASRAPEPKPVSLEEALSLAARAQTVFQLNSAIDALKPHSANPQAAAELTRLNKKLYDTRFQKALEDARSATTLSEMEQASDALREFAGKKDAAAEIDRLTAEIARLRTEADQAALNKALLEANSATTSLRLGNAIHALELLKDSEEARTEVARLRVKYDELVKQEQRKSRMKRLIGIGSVVAVIAVVVLYIAVIQPNAQHKKVQELLDAGDGIAALEVLDALGSKATEEELSLARRAAVDQYLEAGDTSAAFNMIDTYDVDVSDLLAPHADRYLEEGNAVAALALYDRLGDSADPQKRHDAYDGAIGQLIEANNADEAVSMLETSPLASAEAAEMMIGHGAALEETDRCNIAGAIGAVYTVLEDQLAYCDALFAADYDLVKVYPEGVSVDTDLSAYDRYQLEDAGVPDSGKLLAFSKKAPEPELAHPIEGVTEKTKEEKPTEVRLLPAVLYALPEASRASSWADCADLLIAESIYVESGSFSIETVQTFNGKSLPAVTIDYSHFALIEMVNVYAKDDPSAALNLFFNVNYPQAADETWLNARGDEMKIANNTPGASSKTSWINPENMLGQPSTEQPLLQNTERCALRLAESSPIELFIEQLVQAPQEPETTNTSPSQDPS